MNFKEGQRIIAIANGFDYGCKGTTFEGLKEETKMKPGDTVLAKGCKGMMLKFNGKTGIIVENENDIISEFPYRVCFDGTGISCGYLFADSELELVDEYPMDYTAAFKALIDGKMVIDSEGSILSFNKDIMRFQCKTENGYVLNVDTVLNDVKFKEYVAAPKFKRGDFVTTVHLKCSVYYRVFKVYPMTNGEYCYGITEFSDTYEHSDGNMIAKESELLEVTQ